VTAATGRQVQTQLSFEVDLLGDETPTQKIEKLFLIHREAFKKNVITDDWRGKAATSPSAIAQSLLSESVVDAIRKDIRARSKFNADVRDLTELLKKDVIRAELLS
jgi:hypothetical protein